MWIDFYSPTGTLTASNYVALPSACSSGTHCSLSIGTADGWFQDTDGLISRSSDLTTLSVPCFDIPHGSPMSITANKTIAAFTYTGAMALSSAITNDFYGIFGTPGIRQSASVDGSSFWISGGGAQGRGFQYLSSLDAGVTSYVSGAVAGEPGFEDARGVTIFNGQLYGSDSVLDVFDTNVYTGESLSCTMRKAIAPL